MTSEAVNEGRPMAWLAVLEQMRATLGRSLELAVEPEPVPPPEGGAAAAALQALDERLARLQGCLERAEQNARAADAVLEAEAQAMRRWLEAMRLSGSRLAEGSRRVA